MKMKNLDNIKSRKLSYEDDKNTLEIMFFIFTALGNKMVLILGSQTRHFS
jgi:hypothetical protein